MNNYAYELKLPRSNADILIETYMMFTIIYSVESGMADERFRMTDDELVKVTNALIAFCQHKGLEVDHG